jgi:outer membrane protein
MILGNTMGYPGKMFGKICIKTAIVFLLAFLPVISAKSENLLDIYNHALKSDPIYLGVWFKNKAAHEKESQAISGFLPSISLNAETGDTRQNVVSSQITIYRTGLSTYGSNRITLTLTQPVYHHSALVGLRQAETEIKRADSELKHFGQDLAFRVATTYFKALTAQDDLAFANAEHSSLKLHNVATQVQKEKGLSTLSDLYDSRARLATMEARLIEATDAWDDAVETIRELCGISTNRLSGIVKELEYVEPDPPDVRPWIQAAMEMNPELQEKRHTAEATIQEIERLKSERYPVLDIVARGSKDRSGGSLYGGGSDVQTANAILQLSFPLYSGGILQSRIKEAEFRYQGALQEVEQIRRAVERQTRDAFFGVTRTIGKVGALHQAVIAQELALEGKEDGFRTGVNSSLDVLDAERDLFQARRDYARARYEYILNSLRLKELVGRLGEPDLEVVNNWLE